MEATQEIPSWCTSSQDLSPQATKVIELKSLILAQIERWRHA
jgi:hypothetical protein